MPYFKTLTSSNRLSLGPFLPMPSLLSYRMVEGHLVPLLNNPMMDVVLLKCMSTSSIKHSFASAFFTIRSSFSSDIYREKASYRKRSYFSARHLKVLRARQHKHPYLELRWVGRVNRNSNAPWGKKKGC